MANDPDPRHPQPKVSKLSAGNRNNITITQGAITVTNQSVPGQLGGTCYCYAQLLDPETQALRYDFSNLPVNNPNDTNVTPSNYVHYGQGEGPAPEFPDQIPYCSIVYY